MLNSNSDCGPAAARAFQPIAFCAETCNWGLWASDADCDDGGPGSEFRPAPPPGPTACGMRPDLQYKVCV